MRQHKQTEQQCSENLNQKTKWQKFEYREIKRKQIQGAPYNPRKITDYAKKLLKEKIKAVGCVEPLVWNEKTSHLISGHQRLNILDDLEDNLDYLVAVAVVQLTQKQEKELNVFLNNTTAQGFYDKDAFFELLEDPEISLGGIGFTKMDLEMEFGELPRSIEGISPIKQHEDSVKEIVENIESMASKRKKNAQRKADNEADDADYYLMVAFNSSKEKDKFLLKINCPTNMQYISFEELSQHLIERVK